MAENRNQGFAALLRQTIVPVVTIEDPAKAVPLARALSDGGLPLIEVTLRTDGALAAIRAIADELAGRAAVGAGTVRTPADAQRALRAGAAFLVSPGVTPSLIQASRDWPVPFMPGVATASEAMALADLGFTYQKFFPAEQAGGAAALKALAAPLPNIRFCPTGGIRPENAGDYLGLANVVCVGGSWLMPAADIEAGRFEAIRARAEAAAALGATQ
jgi:2-dehydro-3-deoxyphosphogluconate aldolase/(4S)-4-hydroxy-2-oxoglutarate aldolase